MRLSMAPRESLWGKDKLLPGRQHRDFLSVSAEDDAAGKLVDAVACGSTPGRPHSKRRILAGGPDAMIKYPEPFLQVTVIQTFLHKSILRAFEGL